MLPDGGVRILGQFINDSRNELISIIPPTPWHVFRLKAVYLWTVIWKSPDFMRHCSFPLLGRTSVIPYHIPMSSGNAFPLIPFGFQTTSEQWLPTSSGHLYFLFASLPTPTNEVTFLPNLRVANYVKQFGENWGVFMIIWWNDFMETNKAGKINMLLYYWTFDC